MKMVSKNNGYECDVCGKLLSTKSGLVGHKMFAHPEPVERPGGSPEEALVELLSCVKESLDKMDVRVKEWGNQIEGLVAQLAATDSRMDGFQGSFMERLQVAQEAQQTAERRFDEVGARHSIPTVAEAKLMAADCAECAERLGLLVDDGAAARGWSNPGPEAAAEAATELPPKRWLIMQPGGGHRGFKWDDGREMYCKVTDDESEVEQARGRKGWQVEEIPSCK